MFLTHVPENKKAGKQARVFTAPLNSSLYKILYVHFSSGSALDLLRQIASELVLEPAHFRGDLVRQIAGAIVRLNQSKKQHPILICDEAPCCRIPLWNNFRCNTCSDLVPTHDSFLAIGRSVIEWNRQSLAWKTVFLNPLQRSSSFGGDCHSLEPGVRNSGSSVAAVFKRFSNRWRESNLMQPG